MSDDAATGVECSVCGGPVPWSDLHDMAQSIGEGDGEVVRSAVLYGLVVVRHPQCTLEAGER